MVLVLIYTISVLVYGTLKPIVGVQIAQLCFSYYTVKYKQINNKTIEAF